mmetsp:Transcript_612/g.1777  ORF Transcript_612/g.1777 Transcript_612/m.1777 type:complete len:131 (-) Transcript_612:42-434(-)
MSWIVRHFPLCHDEKGNGAELFLFVVETVVAKGITSSVWKMTDYSSKQYGTNKTVSGRLYIGAIKHEHQSAHPLSSYNPFCAWQSDQSSSSKKTIQFPVCGGKRISNSSHHYYQSLPTFATCSRPFITLL